MKLNGPFPGFIFETENGLIPLLFSLRPKEGRMWAGRQYLFSMLSVC